MAIANFIPEIWSAGIIKERDRVAVGVKNCNRNWEGEIKSKGSKVRITSIGDVTIKDYVRDTDIAAPDRAQDAGMFLEITEQKYFNVGLDDVDKAQSKDDVMGELQRKAGVSIANTMDDFVFAKYVDAGNTITATLTSANVFSTLTQVLRWFQRQNVSEGMKKILEVSPEVAEKMILAKIVKDMNNSDIIKSGKIGEFFGMDIYASTGIVTSGTYPTTLSHCIARTEDAITFAEQFEKIEAYRPEKRFEDALKGVYVYGAKTVRPKELIHLALTCASETAI